MLYDPKWEIQTTIEPISLVAFIAWLETKNPGQEYNYMNCSGACLIDQYGDSFGLKHLASHGSHLEKIFGGPMWRGYHYVCGDTPWTFGAALERARNLAAKSALTI